MINSESLSISENLRCKQSEVREESSCSVKSELTKPQLLKKYSINYLEYINSIYVQEIDKIVRSISHSPILFQLYRSQSIYTLISHTVQVLMMNFIEVSIFSQVLRQILNINQTLPSEYFFFYVGWAVKKIFCEDLQYYKEYLRTKFINFEENFENWERASGIFLIFSTKDINLLFKEGRKGAYNMDLSFYVDQILQSSPPYQIESREVMKSILDEKTELSDEGFQEGNVQNFQKKAYERINTALSKYTLETIDNNRIANEKKDKDQFLLRISRLL